MNKRDLKKLTKAQLIKLLLKQQAQKPRNSVKHEDIIQPPEQFSDTYKPIPPPRTGKWESVKPKPVPRKSVKKMVNEYEDIIQPPEQFRDARRPLKPTRKPPPVPKVEEYITNVPVPKIKELNKALKGHAKLYEIELHDNVNPLNHFTKTTPQTESHLEDLLKTMKGFKFIETLEVTFEKDTIDSKTGKRHFNKNLKMTDEDMDDFKRSNKCYICNGKYVEGEKPMKDHCRITGNYLGSAHDAICSKLRMNPDKIRIPVIFHNLRRYDTHLIMQQIGKIAKDKSYVDKNGERKNLKINAIPNNMERYMAFMLGNNLTFIDSFQFMSSSLDKLVSNMRKEDLKYTSTAFYGYKLDLMSKRSIPIRLHG